MRERTRIGGRNDGGAILDLGCSSGGFLGSLDPSDWKLFGIEMSDRVARIAEAKCGAMVFVGDILDAPFPRQSFDVITCFHVFEHLYNPRDVLVKAYEWLKPGGIFYAMMPNIDSAGGHIFKSYWYALELPRHLFHFSPASLKKLAESTGFQVAALSAKRELFVEGSMHYVLDEILRKLGISRTPLARSTGPSIPVKVIRKIFRLSILPLLGALAHFVGQGESIHVVLQKPSLANDEASPSPRA
jgi:SAM-dependent methyltransferase